MPGQNAMLATPDAAIYNAAVRAVPMPPRIARLPISRRGFPVPWFVWWNEGEPDFRVIAPGKMASAIKHRRCWICGERLGVIGAFVIGPMCAVNRIISEPPSHRDCAIFAVRACPFLATPAARRNAVGLPTQRHDAAGVPLDRNPGAAAIWATRIYAPFQARMGNDGILFKFGTPEQVEWFAEGQPATRAQVDAAIAAGLVLVMAQAQSEGPRSVADLRVAVDAVVPYLPPAALAPALGACSATQTAVADGRLYCAMATATGPLVVAVADAAGVPVLVTGRAASAVAATCAVIGAIPVAPPAVPAATPVVSVPAV